MLTKPDSFAPAAVPRFLKAGSIRGAIRSADHGRRGLESDGRDLTQPLAVPLPQLVPERSRPVRARSAPLGSVRGRVPGAVAAVDPRRERARAEADASGTPAARRRAPAHGSRDSPCTTTRERGCSAGVSIQAPDG
jgi:hypothetical protein